MIIKIKQFINRKLKIYHWYQVAITYKKKNNLIFRSRFIIGVDHQSQLLDFRKLKKYHVPEIAAEMKIYLCNGSFFLEPVCYLGYFKDINK